MTAESPVRTISADLQILFSFVADLFVVQEHVGRVQAHSRGSWTDRGEEVADFRPVGRYPGRVIPSNIFCVKEA